MRSTIKQILILCGLVLCVIAPSHAEWRVSDADGSLRVGPLTSSADVNAAKSHLDREDVAYYENDTSSNESLGFIVVTRQFEDQIDAGPTLDRLYDARVRDYLYVYRGDYANRISIGVFGSYESAARRAELVNELGFDFQVVERFRSTTAVELTVYEPGLTEPDLRRILDGGSRPAIVFENDLPPPQTTVVTEPEPATVITDSSDATTPEAGLAPLAEEQSEPEQPAVSRKQPPVVRMQEESDSNWFWILLMGLVVIVGAAVAFFYLQRQQPTTQAEAGRPEPAKPVAVKTEETVPEPVVEPSVDVRPSVPPAQALTEYAESVLAGRSDDTVNNSLTILGTEDTAIAELIQDLLFLNRLTEQQASLESFAFEPSSLVNNLVSRLGNSSSVAIKSEPADEMPHSISMDAAKLTRVLNILLSYAASRTESGLISISQRFENNQLTLEIRFNPSGKDLKAELGSITNPAASSEDLAIADRVRFGVANRLASVLGGRIDAELTDGEALITVRCAANEVQKSQLMLPSGKTIDDLLAAEENAAKEIEIARVEAEDRIAASAARVSEIEATSSTAIAELEEKISALESSSVDTKNKSTETINFLQAEIAGLEVNRDRQLNVERQEKARAHEELDHLNGQLSAAREQLQHEISARTAAEQQAREQLQQMEAEKAEISARIESERVEKAAALSELSALNTQLSATRDELQKEADARARAEQNAGAEVARLEETLQQTRDSVNTEKHALQSRVDQATQEVEGLKSEIADLRASETGSQQELDTLRQRLTAAEARLAQEDAAHEDATSASDKQVHELLEQLNTARTEAESATQDNQEAQTRLQSTTAETEALRQQLEEQNEALENQAATARQQIEQLQSRLEQAELQLQDEQSERQQVLTESASRAESLSRELAELEASKAQALANQEQKIVEASDKISQLTQSLLDAESQLEKQESTDNPLTQEVNQLKQELRTAEDRLEIELTKRNSTESAAGAQIDDLLDEMNQLKAETQAREEQSLVTINTLETRYSALDAEYQNLKQEVERTTAYAETQTGLLQEALSDTENANKLGAAARKVTQHLKSKIQTLERTVDDLTEQIQQERNQKEKLQDQEQQRAAQAMLAATQAG